jgi:hypothetical protein
MKHYLLSIYQPDGTPPPSGDLERVMRDVSAVNEEMKTAGVWVFSDGLHAASTATVLRLQDGKVLMTDGPYVEGKEHLGGLYILAAPDLDVALDWGRKVARAIPLPIELRPFQGPGGR